MKKENVRGFFLYIFFIQKNANILKSTSFINLQVCDRHAGIPFFHIRSDFNVLELFVFVMCVCVFFSLFFVHSFIFRFIWFFHFIFRFVADSAVLLLLLSFLSFFVYFLCSVLEDNSNVIFVICLFFFPVKLIWQISLKSFMFMYCIL